MNLSKSKLITMVKLYLNNCLFSTLTGNDTKQDFTALTHIISDVNRIDGNSAAKFSETLVVSATDMKTINKIRTIFCNFSETLE